MRTLFADGKNSFWHFAFGFLGVYWWGLTPLFVLYQYLDISEKNVRIDLAEYFVGFLFALACIYIGLLPDNKNLFSLTGL